MYKLSQVAEEDIYQIARYTIRQFGVNQAKKYHNELKKRLSYWQTHHG